jgi:hypothetical protein
MSNNVSRSQKSARQKLLELQQQLTDMENVARMEEEENWKCQEEEQKCQEELRKIVEAKKWVKAEEKRHRAIVEEMISSRCAWLSFS